MATSKINKEVKEVKLPFTWTPQGVNSVHMETLAYTVNTDVRLENIIGVTITSGGSNMSISIGDIGVNYIYFWITEHTETSLSEMQGMARILYY